MLLQTVAQVDGETGAAYRLRELQRYKGVEYLFADPAVGDRERKVMYEQFVAAWIFGLLDTELAESLAEKYEAAKLDGDPWKLDAVTNKVTARERLSASPQKRRTGPRKTLAPHHSQTPRAAQADGQATRS